ncbi:hypothetical protein MTP04_21590 [Lysinibacillus sp. PLM2]|nr:hypothetical protein MTP04_21590 [Lysinibacillus sp. PLM2]
MLQSIGVPGLVIILVIALIIFGPSKLPQLGRAVGQTLKEFKDGTKEVVDDVKQEFVLDDSKKEKENQEKK